MIKCIAVDDEPLALDLLEDNIRQVPYLQLVKRCKNAFEAAEFLQHNQVDLVFLDIQMPGITGLQFLKSLSNRPMVIFITAYKKFALEGFELDVIDYLVKPVSFERFLKAVNKAADYHGFKNAPRAQKEKEFFFVYSEYNLVRVSIKEITHIEGLKDYIKIHLQNSPRPLLTRMSLKAMEEELGSEGFVRIHKSFIVAVDKIISIRKNRIKLGEKTEVPLSDFYSDALYRIVGGKDLIE